MAYECDPPKDDNHVGYRLQVRNKSSVTAVAEAKYDKCECRGSEDAAELAETQKGEALRDMDLIRCEYARRDDNSEHCESMHCCALL